MAYQNHQANGKADAIDEVPLCRSIFYEKMLPEAAHSKEIL